MPEINISFRKDKTIKTSGVMSQLSFQNPDFLNALNRAFGVSGNEVISSISITEQGIKCFFDRKE